MLIRSSRQAKKEKIPAQAKDSLKNIITNILDTELTAFLSSETTIYKISHLRLGLQTVGSFSPLWRAAFQWRGLWFVYWLTNRSLPDFCALQDVFECKQGSPLTFILCPHCRELYVRFAGFPCKISRNSHERNEQVNVHSDLLSLCILLILSMSLSRLGRIRSIGRGSLVTLIYS